MERGIIGLSKEKNHKNLEETFTFQERLTLPLKAVPRPKSFRTIFLFSKKRDCYIYFQAGVMPEIQRLFYLFLFFLASLLSNAYFFWQTSK
jgi:hypothetical protein